MKLSSVLEFFSTALIMLRHPLRLIGFIASLQRKRQVCQHEQFHEQLNYGVVPFIYIKCVSARYLFDSFIVGNVAESGTNKWRVYQIRSKSRLTLVIRLLMSWYPYEDGLMYKGWPCMGWFWS